MELITTSIQGGLQVVTPWCPSKGRKYMYSGEAKPPFERLPTGLAELPCGKELLQHVCLPASGMLGPHVWIMGRQDLPSPGIEVLWEKKGFLCGRSDHSGQMKKKEYTARGLGIHGSGQWGLPLRDIQLWDWTLWNIVMKDYHLGRGRKRLGLARPTGLKSLSLYEEWGGKRGTYCLAGLYNAWEVRLLKAEWNRQKNVYRFCQKILALRQLLQDSQRRRVCGLETLWGVSRKEGGLYVAVRT